MAKNIHIHVHTTDSDFKESDHPRAKNGQFGSGGGGSKATTAKEVQAKKDEQVRAKTHTMSILAGPTSPGFKAAVASQKNKPTSGGSSAGERVAAKGKPKTFREVLDDPKTRPLINSIEEYIGDLRRNPGHKEHIQGLQSTIKELEQKSGYKYDVEPDLLKPAQTYHKAGQEVYTSHRNAPRKATVIGPDPDSKSHTLVKSGTSTISVPSHQIHSSKEEAGKTMGQ